MLRLRLASLITAALIVPPAVGRAQTGAPIDIRPTVAVLTMGGGAIGRNSDNAMLGQGLSELLSTALAKNPGIVMVERARLQDVLKELALDTAVTVTDESRVETGQVLGANHFIAGGFLIGPDRRMRIDVRSINVETSTVEYHETIEGDAGKVFDLVDRLEQRLAAGLHLSPSRASAGLGGLPRGVDQTRALSLFGRAIVAIDHGDTTGAIDAARKALEVHGGFASARQLLTSLEKTQPLKPRN